MKHTCDICCPSDLFEKPVTMSEALDALKDPSICGPNGISSEMRSWFEGLLIDTAGNIYCPCGIGVHRTARSRHDVWIVSHFPHHLIPLPAVHGLTPEPIVTPDSAVLELLFFVTDGAIFARAETNHPKLIYSLRGWHDDGMATWKTVSFEHIKSDLEAFANGFDEAPVPRIEKSGEDYRVFVDDSYGGNDYWIDARAMHGLRQYFGIENTPIYTPTRLRGEWTKLFPIETPVAYEMKFVPEAEMELPRVYMPPERPFEVWRYVLRREG